MVYMKLMLNGKKVGNDYFTPGWTSYHKRLQYQTYDVTSLLKAGTNSTAGNDR
jgi:alpha-L-rhamnosidase